MLRIAESDPTSPRKRGEVKMENLALSDLKTSS